MRYYIAYKAKGTNATHVRSEDFASKAEAKEEMRFNGMTVVAIEETEQALKDFMDSGFSYKDWKKIR